MKDMKKGATPARVLNPQSTIMQQLGLNTTLGMQRLIMLVVHKLDPNGTGAVITEADVKSFVHRVTEEKRRNICVIGQGNDIFLKLVDDAESALLVKYEEEQRNKVKPQ